ncbi:N-6 DNA methylase, partial [Rodentibacter caecimuris]
NQPHFAELVENKKIGENDYNLSVSSYVEQEDTSEKVDITELNTRIADIVKHQAELRTAIDKIVAEIEGK